MPDELDELEDGETLDLQGAGFGVAETTFESNGPYSFLNFIEYGITVASDLDGLYDEIVTTPEMANEQAAGILWVLMTSGFFHRIRFTANEVGDGFHIRLFEATVYYQGQLS
jgi:hypothetical protein